MEQSARFGNSHHVTLPCGRKIPSIGLRREVAFMKTALINTVLALLVAQGCNRQDPTTPEPVLPRAGFVLPEQPEILTPTNERSVQQLKITGTWDVRLDYAQS